MYLAIHQQFSSRRVEAEFWMMTWDILKTREKVPKKISALWNNMYLAIHQRLSGRCVEAEFWMMTWDILETREKVLKKKPAPTISRESSKKISAPTIVDPISKKILLAHYSGISGAQTSTARTRVRGAHQNATYMEKTLG